MRYQKFSRNATEKAVKAASQEKKQTSECSAVIEVKLHASKNFQILKTFHNVGNKQACVRCTENGENNRVTVHGNYCNVVMVTK